MIFFHTPPFFFCRAVFVFKKHNSLLYSCILRMNHKMSGYHLRSIYRKILHVTCIVHNGNERTQSYSYNSFYRIYLEQILLIHTKYRILQVILSMHLTTSTPTLSVPTRTMRRYCTAGKYAFSVGKAAPTIITAKYFFHFFFA